MKYEEDSDWVRRNQEALLKDPIKIKEFKTKRAIRPSSPTSSFEDWREENLQRLGFDPKEYALKAEILRTGEPSASNPYLAEEKI